jgi:hypothetical protein
MIDQDRRMEILKAEEAVRLLAEELARVKQSHLAADKLSRTLAAAQAALEKSATENQKAVQLAVEEASRRLATAQATLEKSVGANQNAVQLAAADASHHLATAHSALDQSERANQRAVQAVEFCAREARATLQDARKHLETLVSEVATGLRELRTNVENLGALPPLLQRTLEQGLGGILRGMDSLRREHEQLAEKPRVQLLGLRRLTVALLLLSLLSVGSSITGLVLLLIR